MSPPLTETEFEWRPTNSNCGRITFCTDCWLLGGSKPVPPVPWSHGREEVPLWLANQGVPLMAWQEWVDRADALWLERNQSNLTTFKTMSCFFLVFLMTMGIAVGTVFFIPFDSVPRVMGILFSLFFVLIVCLKCNSCRAQSKFLQNEAKWSDLIQDINRGKVCKDLGLHVKANQNQDHYYDSDTRAHTSVTYTVGLTFMIEPGRAYP
jgi:hypothetical protein